MADDANIVVCTNAHPAKPPGVAGSELRTCSRCTGAVWLSPATARAMVGLTVDVVCLRCASLDPDLAHVPMPITAGQLGEVAAVDPAAAARFAAQFSDPDPARRSASLKKLLARAMKRGRRG